MSIHTLPLAFAFDFSAQQWRCACCIGQYQYVTVSHRLFLTKWASNSVQCMLRMLLLTTHGTCAIIVSKTANIWLQCAGSNACHLVKCCGRQTGSAMSVRLVGGTSCRSDLRICLPGLGPHPGPLPDPNSPLLLRPPMLMPIPAFPATKAMKHLVSLHQVSSSGPILIGTVCLLKAQCGLQSLLMPEHAASCKCVGSHSLCHNQPWQLAPSTCSHSHRHSLCGGWLRFGDQWEALLQGESTWQCQ